jgi:hypothetical protein
MPEEETAVATDDQEEVEALDVSTHCRHCGRRTETDVSDTPDWLCSHCDRYQDTVACPTCHQPSRASLMDSEVVPAAAKPKRR